MKIKQEQNKCININDKIFGTNQSLRCEIRHVEHLGSFKVDMSLILIQNLKWIIDEA